MAWVAGVGEAARGRGEVRVHALRPPAREVHGRRVQARGHAHAAAERHELLREEQPRRVLRARGAVGRAVDMHLSSAQCEEADVQLESSKASRRHLRVAMDAQTGVLTAEDNI